MMRLSLKTKNAKTNDEIEFRQPKTPKANDEIEFENQQCNKNMIKLSFENQQCQKPIMIFSFENQTCQTPMMTLSFSLGALKGLGPSWPALAGLTANRASPPKPPLFENSIRIRIREFENSIKIRIREFEKSRIREVRFEKLEL